MKSRFPVHHTCPKAKESSKGYHVKITNKAYLPIFFLLPTISL